MKIVFLAIVAVAMSCCSSKTTTANVANNTDENGMPISKNAGDTIPQCVKTLIDQFKAEERQNPPRSIYQYTFKGKTVYYVPAICCDFFSDLYDSDCKIIAHPDGGFSGRGDGKEPEFDKMKSNEKLIWNDPRKTGG